MFRLKPVERDIVRLVAEGWGNDEIARRLHLGCETVKMKLSLIYRMLDIDERKVKRVALAVWYLTTAGSAD